MRNIAYRADRRNEFQTFHSRDLRHRRLPLAARRLKARFGLTDSIALLVAELAGFGQLEG
jgi:hypothetical protein